MPIIRKLLARRVPRTCLRCPRAFDRGCIPPGAAVNTYALHCGRHAYLRLPGEHIYMSTGLSV